MATYLKFHQLERSPFEGTSSDRLVLATEALRSAFAEIKMGLEEDSPRICVGGGPGIGKSSLARALPKLLGQDAQCVLIRDPSRDWARIKASIIKQLCLEAGQLSRASLVTTRRDGRRLVIVIDEAEQLSTESLEHLDVLLGYRDDVGEQLVQAVLLANLDGAPRGQDVPLLWWLDKLTTRQLTFAPVPEGGVRSYIDKHLKKAGAADGSLFEDDAIVAIHRYTGGVPGAVSALCEQLLDKAAAKGSRTVTAALVASVFGEVLEETAPAAEPADSSEPLIDHSNTPPSIEEVGKGDELPKFGDTSLATSVSANAFSSQEPEMKVQQGLLPDEGTNNYGNTYTSNRTEDSDFFGGAGPDPDSGARAATPRFNGPSPGAGRGARMVRNLIGLAVIAVLAVIAHATWSTFSLPTLDSLPNLDITIATSGGNSGEKSNSRKHTPPTPGLANEAADAQREATALDSLLDLASGVSVPGVGADGSEEPGLETDPNGLTSDLRLAPGANNSAALDASNGVDAGTPSNATAPDGSLSLDELHEIAERADAEQTDAEPEVFEPWTQQGPGTAPAAPAPANGR